MTRARSVEIYLKPGIEEDDQVFDIWSSLRGRGRPQDVFRRALRLGLRAMAEGGELPRAAMEMVDPDLLGPAAPARALMKGAQIRAARTKELAARAEPIRKQDYETKDSLPAMDTARSQAPAFDVKTAPEEQSISHRPDAGYPSSVGAPSTSSSPKGKLGRLM